MRTRIGSAASIRESTMKIAPHVLTSTCLLLLSATAVAQEHRAETEGRTPAATRERLEQGNARHRSGEPLRARLGAGARRTAARNQNPIAVVLCCSDGDVTPEFAFDAGLGELVVVRTAGHGLDAASLSTIEEAVVQLGATTLVVLGHDNCGAIQAAAEADADHPTLGASALDHLSRLDPSVQRGRERARTGETLTTAIAEDHAAATAADCLRRSADLRRLQALGRFEALPARYDAATGEVRWLAARAVAASDEEQLRAPHAAPPSMAPHVALRSLVAGNRRFVGDGALLGNHGPAPRTESRTQPMAVVLACSDARVVPELLFDCGSGELCVVRTKDAELTPAALASIELAVSRTGAPLLVTLGHTKCRNEESAARAQQSATEAIQRSALLRGLEAQGRFLAAAAHYDLETGDVTLLPDAPVAKASAKHAANNNASRDSHSAHGAPAAVSQPSESHSAHAAPHQPAPHGETKTIPHGNNADHGAATHDDGHHAPAHATPHAQDTHAADSHPGSQHQDAHGATTHADTHATTKHDDAHGSSTHGDAHATPKHEDSHGAATHGDAHATTEHADSHGAVAHDDAHGTDGAHGAHEAGAKSTHSGNNLVTIIGSAAIASIAVAMFLSLKNRR
jgi:carbonic anhydrase